MVQKKKLEMVESLVATARGASASVFVDYRGLTVAEANQLRVSCTEGQVRYRVVKNRLVKRALAEIGLMPPAEALRGPTAIAFAEEEPTAPARVLLAFAKDCEHIKVKGGFLGDQWLEAAAVEQLSKIPSREALLGRLVGDLRSPLVRLSWVLKASVGQLAQALRAVAEQKAG
jgi:large subunit ribosomal protein L10